MALPIPTAVAPPPFPLPPEAPTISAFAAQRGGEVGDAQVGGLTRLFFEVERTIDTLAAGLPGAAAQLDSIKQQLRAVLTNAVQKGAGGTPPANYAGPAQVQGGMEPY